MLDKRSGLNRFILRRSIYNNYIKTKKMKFTKELITPVIAKQMLAKMPLNRSIKKYKIQQYCDDMENGRWKEDTGETIKISKEGNIIDGQHRLLSIIKTGKSIQLTVARGINEDVMTVIDTGASRSAKDAFKLSGIKHETIISASINKYISLRDSIIDSKSGTNSMFLEEYHKREKFWNVVAGKTTVWYKAFAKILPPSFIGGIYAFLYERNPDIVDSFFEQISFGENIQNDTLTQLRNRLLSDKLSARKIGVGIKTALIIKTWNYFVRNEEVKYLRYDPIKEDFPVALGRAAVSPKQPFSENGSTLKSAHQIAV